MNKPVNESPTVRAYRELLGVTVLTTGEELKKAYHRLALLYHPDRNLGGESAEDFHKVQAAYAILSDPVQVRELNQSHIKERLFRHVVGGLDISFGAFFGYRHFTPMTTRIERRFRLGSERTGESDVESFLTGVSGPLESDISILDSPGHDAIEIVYAGKFSVGDEERLQADMKGNHLRQLPWVVLNNQGLIHFLEGDIGRAQQCYTELNERIPKNIIFMYRLGLCHILNAFTEARRDIFGRRRPERKQIDAGILLFRNCISLAETRTVGKMNCLLIRKLLADVLEKTGRKRQARQVWRDILKRKPNSIEAVVKVKGWSSAHALLQAHLKRTKATVKANRLLLKGSSD